MMERAWTGVILAGGQSSRMGRDKALLEVDGTTLLDRAVHLLRPHAREILVIGDPAKYAPPHAEVIADEQPGLGPLAGIVTALKRARYVRLLVLACDMPNLNDRLLIHLKQGLTGDIDAVVPRHGTYVEPLAAAYHRHALDAFTDQLAKGHGRMTEALGRIHTAYVDLVPGSEGWPADLFRNLNAPTDL